MALIDRGLNLSNFDETTPEEVEAFKLHYASWDGRSHIGLNTFLENRPDALKRYRLFGHFLATAPTTAVTPENAAEQEVDGNRTGSFGLIWFYGMLGFTAGVAYVVRNKQMYGYTKDQCWEGMSVAFLYGGPRTMESVANALEGYEWTEPAHPPRFHGAWAPDPDAFRSGLDFSSPDLTPAELRLLEDWYQRAIGYVPRHVGFMAEVHPQLLKAYRNRYEHCLVTLPKQVMPATLLSIQLHRQDREGIRENLHLARAFGMAREEVLHALYNVLLYGGMETATLFDEVGGDLLRRWDEE